MTGSFDREAWAIRARRTAIGLAVLLVVIGLLGFFVAPGIIKSVAEKQLTEALGRKTTIGGVHVNPYLLAATLDDVRLYQADGNDIALQADVIVVDVSSASLFKRALVFDALKIGKPVIHVTRLAPQRFDFSDIVEKLAAQPKSDAPLHYSINNIEIDDGTIAIDDRVTARKHVVDQIKVGLPFISDLPYDAAIFVTPLFSARVDGSTIGLSGKAQPFSTSHEAMLAFELAGLDLTEYVDLSPTRLPFRLASGKLSAQLSLSFRAATTDAAGKVVPQAITLAGHVGLAMLDIADPAGHHALGADAIDVDITRLDPISGEVDLARVTVDAPAVEATRRADGSIDLVDLFRMPQARSSSAPSSSAPTDSVATSAPISIDALSIAKGSVRFVDRSLPKPSTTTIHDIDVQAASIALHGTIPATYRISLVADQGATISAEGSMVIEKKQCEGTVDVKGFRPSTIAPYLAGVLAARIDDGSIDAHARYRIDASGATLAGLVDDASLHIARLRTSLPDDKAALLGAEAVALDGASFDLGTRAFTAESLVLTAPVIAIRRDAKGRVNLQAAIVEARPTARPAGAAVEIVPAKAQPFTALVKSFGIARGDITLDDLAVPNPVHVRAQPFDFKATNVGTGTKSAGNAVVPFELDTGVDQRGKLSVHGKVALAPVVVDARIDASQVAVGWLAGYLGDRLNIVIDSADLDTKGTLHFAEARSASGSPTIAYRGSLRVARMRTRDRLTSEPFVEWQTLDVPSVDLQMPSAHAPLAVALGKVAVTDFYARLIVNTNGRLNLQDVVSATGDRQSVTRPDADDSPATPQPAPATDAPKLSIRVAGVKLANGRIGITDNFIKPNYSADLTDLDGEVDAISSDDPKPAALKLGGRIDGEGTLDVGGTINPLASTLYVDIAAEAKDIELTRLTPYAVKYAGYAIERGKLSTTVKYHIENGRLQASNKLFLDQLTFGEHDASSSANLPVRLAVALLANAKGEINIELPVSGSLSDPQFSVGGVLWHAFLNILAKAATSPFALIGAGFGGGSDGELGYIQFKPGVSDLTDMGKTKLETLAKALADRPALKLDIIGRYDPATDPDGIRKDHLLDRLKDLKARDQSKSGERVTRDQVTIEPGAEYAKYLAQVYDDTKLPDKPRNVIGIAKAQSTEEMERLLLANIKLDSDDPRWLAEARADVVRHYIEGTGKIAAGRVFLVTPKLDAAGIDDKGAPNRVDFAIR